MIVAANNAPCGHVLQQAPSLGPAVEPVSCSTLRVCLLPCLNSAAHAVLLHATVCHACLYCASDAGANCFLQ